jgi:hypothetical protein
MKSGRDMSALSDSLFVFCIVLFGSEHLILKTRKRMDMHVCCCEVALSAQGIACCRSLIILWAYTAPRMPKTITIMIVMAREIKAASLPKEV